MLSKIFTTVRYSLVTINFLFLITGIIILSVGASVQSSYNQYQPFLAGRFFSLPAFCIATGIIIFLISFAGFYGAFMENYYMNMAFAGSMVLIFIFQLSVCIAGYALKGNTMAVVQQSLMDTMEVYLPPNNSFEVTRLWDEVQQDFTCCGVRNASDWVAVTGDMPVSCCGRTYGAIGILNCTLENAFPTGCVDSFGGWVKSHAASIGVAGVFLVLMQALAVAGAVWIAKVQRSERI